MSLLKPKQPTRLIETTAGLSSVPIQHSGVKTMANPIKSVLSKGLRLTEQASTYTGNAFDRLFRSASLIQAGQTPFETLYNDGLVSLRYYPRLAESEVEIGGEVVGVSRETHKVPVVIIPPLAVNMLIYDLFPTRSLVRFLRAKGFEVYLIDWGTPTKKQSHFNMHTYVGELMPNYLERIREHNGQRQLTLHGWSMGGMFTLFYSALSQDRDIRNLVLLGAPVDSHASGVLGIVYKLFSEAAEVVRRNTGFRIHNLKPDWFYTPGWMNTLGFKLTNPVGSVMGYWELVVRLGDRQFVRDHATTSAFLDRMVAYPGGIIQDTLVRVWIDNSLSKGEIQIGEQVARLSDVNANLFAIAGASDTLVTPRAARMVMDVVSSEDKTFRTVPGGHMGILAGSHAPESWRVLAAWLAERSD